MSSKRSTGAFLYQQVAHLGASAQVWNEAYRELHESLSAYGEGYHSVTPPAFDEMLFDLSLPGQPADKDPEDKRLYRKFDYARLAGETDHDFVKRLLKRADDNRRHYLEECELIRAQSGFTRPLADEEEVIDWEAYDAAVDEWEAAPI